MAALNSTIFFFLLQSSYSDNSIVAPPGYVLAVENSLRYLAYSGTSSGTRSLLNNIQNRFGSISSFTSTYRADGWNLTIGSQIPSCSKYSCLIIGFRVFE